MAIQIQKQRSAPINPQEIDRSISKMEQCLNQSDFLQLYLEQLSFLEAVGVFARKTKSVFNLFSGIDLFPAHYAKVMHSLDNRLFQEQIPEVLATLRNIVSMELLEPPDPFPLAANLNREKSIVHESSDAVINGLPDKWINSMHPGDVLFCKQLVQYGETFNGPECNSSFIENLVKTVPRGVVVVVIENIVDRATTQSSSLVSVSLNSRLQENSDYCDFLTSRLSEPQQKRLAAINDMITFKALTTYVDSTRFQLMLAGKLSVFTKN
ncbi:MAG: hypothetical protein ACK5GN_08850 [Pseudomonadota bacterium]|jgi:hypothetical protein